MAKPLTYAQLMKKQQKARVAAVKAGKHYGGNAPNPRRKSH